MRAPSLRRLVAVSSLAAAVTIAGAAPARIEGRVVRVDGGDSLVFAPAAPGAAEQAVAIVGIAAPLPCQAWGAESRKALAELVLDKPVSLSLLGKPGSGGRVAATVVVDGADVGARMVTDGNAWSSRGRNGHGPYIKQERVAAALQRGLHGGGGALRPEDFRSQRGGC